MRNKRFALTRSRPTSCKRWTNCAYWKPAARQPIFALGMQRRCSGVHLHAILIPNEWRTVGPRFTRVYATGSRNASHQVNAILNYAYAVLQTQVQIRLVTEGYDPMLGIMHADRDGAPAFVFDTIEPERPKVDRAVLAFLRSEALHPADFTIREDGVVRLNPELARRVAGLMSGQRMKVFGTV